MTITFFLAIFIGISLGLIGGGGSILTVPVLVYTAHIKASEAMGYSLFVVGATAWLGVFQKAFKGQVEAKIGLVFVVPSLLMVYLTRHFVLPALPEMWNMGVFTIHKDKALMLIFATLMLASSRAMLYASHVQTPVTPQPLKILPIVNKALLVGLLTGFVGAGGGFLIVPALVLLIGLEMKNAVGTSLFIIGINSTVGFLTDLQKVHTIQWHFLLIFTSLAVVGAWIGNYFAQSVPNARLKKLFGYFVLLMGVSIWILELLRL
jgi:uncharacterized protein